MLAALVLRLHGLGKANLWLDEANSWYVAHLPWPALWTNLRASPLGPLYFVALKLWIGVAGASEPALRAPSLIASIALIPLVYALGVRTVSHRAACIGAALTALSPLQLYFAQEARMYMPLALLACAVLLAYVVWRNHVTQPMNVATPRRQSIVALAVYSILSMAMLGTNAVAGPLLAAINMDALFVLARQIPAPRRRGGIAEWVIANGVIVAAALAFLLFVVPRAAEASQAWRGALGIVGATQSLFEYPMSAIHGVYFYSDELVRAFGDVRYTPSRTAIRRFATLFLAQPVVVGVVVVAIARVWREAGRSRARVLTFAVLVPVIIGAVISVRRQVDLTRYFLYATTPLFLLLGAGLARLSRRACAIALACCGAAIAIGTQRTYAVVSRDSDYRSIARDLMVRHAQAGAVIVQPSEMYEPLSYYLNGRLDLPITRVAQRAPLAPVIARAGHKPVWVVIDYRSPLYGTPPDSLESALGECVTSDTYDAASGAGVRLVLAVPSRCGAPAPSIPASSALPNRAGNATCATCR
ncbi:MAG TPA: glycosyltransferase family 39 protein [Gemmatimonadaceae bacterium]|nr:glycosyltransferase family 39 protein [Gemmatimonadaceae bacterium]